jgi:hypothetical protein
VKIKLTVTLRGQKTYPEGAIFTSPFPSDIQSEVTYCRRHPERKTFKVIEDAIKEVIEEVIEEPSVVLNEIAEEIEKTPEPSSDEVQPVTESIVIKRRTRAKVKTR